VHVQSIRNGELPIEYTPKPLSGWGGLALFFEYLEKIEFIETLEQALTNTKTSHNQVQNSEVLLTFLTTVLTGGNRFAHVQRICHDEVIRTMLGAKRLASADTVRRLFLGLTRSQSEDLYTALQQFASTLLTRNFQEDVLDLDSTILERYGHQEGVGKGYHASRRGQTSHHPLLGMLAKSRHIPLVWLRAGGASTLRGAAQFVEELLGRLPPGLRITAIRADSGFYNEEYLRVFEDKGLPYIIPIRMHAPMQRFVDGIAHDQWKRLNEDHQIADVMYHPPGWARARRVLAIRRVIRTDEKGRLFEVPSYKTSALVTTLDLSATECSHFYDQRGECENTIKEFKNDFGARGFSLQSFTATETAFRVISVLFNLVTEFKRHVLQNTSLTLNTIRSTVFVLGAMLGRSARKIILRLGIRHPETRFAGLLVRANSATYLAAPQFADSA
jgi:hypothetical protein